MLRFSSIWQQPQILGVPQDEEDVNQCFFSDDFLHRRLKMKKSPSRDYKILCQRSKRPLPSTDNKGVTKDPISVSPDALFSGKSRLQTSEVVQFHNRDRIRHRIRSAAYIMGSADYTNLFDHIDKNHSSTLDYDEFHSVVRRVHLSSSLSDAHVQHSR